MSCRRSTTRCPSTSPSFSIAPRTTRCASTPTSTSRWCPTPTVIIVGLPAGLRLAVDNAIANAVKHGGATRVQLSAVSSRAGVEIAIDDDGVGVPEEERAGLFERFVQRVDGVALGLGPGPGVGRPAGPIAWRYCDIGAEPTGWRPVAAAPPGPVLAGLLLPALRLSAVPSVESGGLGRRDVAEPDLGDGHVVRRALR